MPAKRTNTPKRGARTTKGPTNLDPMPTPMTNGNGQAESSREIPRTTEVAPAASESLEREIQRRAYEIFLSRRGGDGDDLTDWLEAERIVRRLTSSTAPSGVRTATGAETSSRG
jgi:hypothetical protein